MKRYFFACLCAVAAIVACDPMEDEGIKTVGITVTVDESNLAEGQTPESYAVTFTNTATNVSSSATTENGVATAQLIPGIYTILVKASLSDGGFTYTITGSAKDVSVLADGTTQTIAVDIVKESQLIIKETYYTGCTFKTGEVDDNGVESEGTYFRDQFHEIYNNSDEVAYADGLCIAYTDFASYDYTNFYEWNIENADDYVFVKYIWQIPGDGTQYPIQPGESIIIAQWASNHKAEALTNGFSPVDLSSAEFETIEGPKELWNANITDGPAVNCLFKVDALGYGLMQWLVPVGGSNLIIFKPSTPLRTENFITTVDDASEAHEVAIADILDAVQSIDDETRIQTLGMPAILDAGYIWCSGSYVGESIARKQIGTLANGKPKYQDTNNTTADFEVQTTPMIRRGGAGIPSWNTWAN